MFFFFNDTATTEIYTLSLHDALPIFSGESVWNGDQSASGWQLVTADLTPYAGQNILLRFSFRTDRKSTRLNSSHGYISYAVFCLKKKKKHKRQITINIPTILSY